MHKLVDLFCHVDDFCKAFLPHWQKLQLESGEKKRNRKGRMSESEIMTIIVAFHMSHQRDFKNFTWELSVVITKVISQHSSATPDFLK